MPAIRRHSSLKGATKDKLVAKLLLLFDEADHDGGGTVDKTEMICLLRENQQKLCRVVPALKTLDFASTVCSDALFNRFDIDGDGELDKDEFVGGFVFEARPERAPRTAPRGAPHRFNRQHPVAVHRAWRLVRCRW